MGAIGTEHLPQYKISDYQQWEGDWELIRGIPYSMSPSATRRHQAVAGKMFTLLSDAIASHSCTCEVYYELDLIMANDTVVRPDLMLLCENFDGDYPADPPGIIVEVISPSTEKVDRSLKFQLYAEFRVPYYIIIDIDKKKVEPFGLKDGAFQLMAPDEFFHLKDCEISLDFTSLV